ncbi:GNAT family N-acetyltransferase [Kribbella sp. NPDC055071]
MILAPLGGAGRDVVEAARRIYVDGFPQRQREPFDELLAAVRSGDELGWVQLDNDVPTGIAFARLLTSVDWLFLEYYAIDRSIRSRGYGTALWHSMLDAAPVRRVILEVEEPDEAGDSEERIIRQRRIAFYERLGAELVENVEYVVPDLTGSGTEELRLMWLDPARPKLDRSELRRLLPALYCEGYELPRDHHLLAAALKSLDEEG